MITKQQQKMAELLVSGQYSIVECYIQAYMDNSDYEHTASNYTRAELTSKATRASRSSGVMRLVETLREKIKNDTAEDLLWSKEIATRTIFNVVKIYDWNLNLMEDYKKQLEKNKELTPKVLEEVTRIIHIATKGKMNAIAELNKLHGLNIPLTSTADRVQVIIGTPDKLPADVDDTH